VVDQVEGRSLEKANRGVGLRVPRALFHIEVLRRACGREAWRLGKRRRHTTSAVLYAVEVGWFPKRKAD